MIKIYSKKNKFKFTNLTMRYYEFLCNKILLKHIVFFKLRKKIKNKK